MRLYIGNLDYATTNQQLMELFAQSAQVEQAYVVQDRETRRSCGFGFVVIEDEQQAQAAIQSFHGSLFLGRALVVNEARERQEQSERPRYSRPAYTPNAAPRRERYQ